MLIEGQKIRIITLVAYCWAILGQTLPPLVVNQMVSLVKVEPTFTFGHTQCIDHDNPCIFGH